MVGGLVLACGRRNCGWCDRRDVEQYPRGIAAIWYFGVRWMRRITSVLGLLLCAMPVHAQGYSASWWFESGSRPVLVVGTRIGTLDSVFGRSALRLDVSTFLGPDLGGIAIQWQLPVASNASLIVGGGARLDGQSLRRSGALLGFQVRF